MNVEKLEYILHPALGAMRRSMIDNNSIHQYADNSSVAWAHLDEESQFNVSEQYICEVVRWADSVGIVKSAWASPGYRETNRLALNIGLPEKGEFDWNLAIFSRLLEVNISEFYIKCENGFELLCHDSWDNIYCNKVDVLPEKLKTDKWLKEQLVE